MYGTDITFLNYKKQFPMKKINVALLSGGISSERDVSLNGGNQVFESLDKEKYNIVRYDPESDLEQLVKDASRISVALIILHGPYGEDGTIQGLLDLLKIPYQGSGVLGSALAMNKLASKQIYEQAGLPIPPYIVANRGEAVDSEGCIRQLGLPLVIKPVQGGSSIGMSIVHSEDNLKEAFEVAFEQDDTILIEAFIDGIELTGSVIGNDNPEALPIVEIIPDEVYPFFNYEAKYTPGATREICPARIDDDLTEQVKMYAKEAHKVLFCRGYSRTDFILNGRNAYVIETNTIPGMTPTSLLPLAAKTAGVSFSRLLDRLIELSIEDHNK